VALVLLVDDEPVILRMLEVNLVAQGFEVRTAGTGNRALEIAAERMPDAMVLDLGLPDMHGWELLRRLRELGGAVPVPAVVLSGVERDGADARGYAAEVQAFLTKPVEPTDLVETVRRVLRRDA
jgi:DNA-binding response OmpR family regulator